MAQYFEQRLVIFIAKYCEVVSQSAKVAALWSDSFFSPLSVYLSVQIGR